MTIFLDSVDVQHSVLCVFAVGGGERGGGMCDVRLFWDDNSEYRDGHKFFETMQLEKTLLPRPVVHSRVQFHTTMNELCNQLLGTCNIYIVLEREHGNAKRHIISYLFRM